MASGLLGVVWVYLASILVAALTAIWLRRRASARAAAATARFVRLRRAVISLCAVSAVSFAAALIANAIAIRPPKQAWVAARLQAHRAGFDRLREMVVTDRLETVHDYGSKYAREQESLIFKSPGDAGIAPEQAAEYTRLMRAVGCQRVDVWRDGTVSFSVAAWGTASRGWRVNLAWSKDEPHPLLPTIDGFPATKASGGPDHAFSRIEGPWYAYMIW